MCRNFQTESALIMGGGVALAKTPPIISKTGGPWHAPSVSPDRRRAGLRGGARSAGRACGW